MLSGKLQEIYKIYDQYSNIQPSFLELEAKFGYYSGRNFTSSVPYVHYERLLNVLRNLPQASSEITQESSVSHAGDIRRIISQTDDGELITWQRKTKLKEIELPDYDVRITANKEDTLLPDQIPKDFKPVIIRDRTRRSFNLNDNMIRIDLTEVMIKDSDKVIRPRYEIEVEFLSTKDNLSVFSEYVDKVFKWLRGTNLIYTNDIKNKLIDDTTKILGGSRSDMIDKDVFVEARNIKYRDLVYGGIVGNKSLLDPNVLTTKVNNGTNYMITFKADGLRKMLIIHSTGIWLVYPPFEFNLVVDMSLKIPQLDKLLTGFNGTILDGELVDPKTPKNIAYWYLGFDCLAFKGSSGIQSRSYRERQQIVLALAGAMKTQFLTIDTKDTKEITSPSDFFRLVNEFLNKREQLEYNEDGLMFIPIDVIYNPRSQKYPLKDRSLVKIPDTCKWKEATDITIDFAIKWIDNGRLELYSYDDTKNEMVPFHGDVINPLTSDMIDYKNPLTLNKPTNLVVEYEWVKGILRPRRIRYDKAGPNRLSIALDDWEDIRNPITEQDIRGNTLVMTFAYHNRIKKNLYNLIPKGSNILDIGSGRGGDVAKWSKLRRIVAVEPNKDNAKELVSRLNTFNMKDRVRVLETGGEDTVTITNSVREFIPDGKVDVVTLMLSMSFFWASDSHLDALIRTIVANLKPGGMIVFLTINGDVIEQIFEPPLGGNKITEKTISTAKIHLYPRQDPPFGRPLDFILPNTIVGNQREYIVKINDFTNRLNTYGIVNREIHRAEEEKLLSDNNLLFSSMFSYGHYVNDDQQALIQNIPVSNISLPSLPSPTSIPSLKPSVPSLPSLPSVPSLKPSVSSVPSLNPSLNPSVPSLNLSVPSVPSLNLSVPSVPSLNLLSVPSLNPSVPSVPSVPSLNPSVQIKKITDNTQLPALSVKYLGDNGKILEGPAVNDDTYAPLKCTWYDKLVRIATIGDGSCFIHAILKAYYKNYQENNSAIYRINTAAQVRRDLAVILGDEDRLYPGHIYWETAGNGAFPRMVMQQIKDENLVGELGIDYSINGLQRLFNSYSWLGDEVYAFISNVIGVNIYILRATQLDLYPHYNTYRPNRKSIVVIGNTYHYEVVGVDKQEGFQTIFYDEDPFMKELRKVFIGTTNYNNKYDPDQGFYQDALEIFTTKEGVVIPTIIDEIFSEKDPFRIMINRLRMKL